MKKKSSISRSASKATEKPAAEWTFLTNHAHVLWCIFRQPAVRLREIAADVGITERMVHKIVTELAEAKYLEIEKDGRRNVYRLLVNRPLRHPLESHCEVGQLLNLLRKTIS